MSMPNVSAYAAAQAHINKAVNRERTNRTEPKKDKEDEEDFIVIQSTIPTPSQVSYYQTLITFY
jgi:hypothetical protein